MQLTNKNSKGFVIIEVVVATTLFVLLMAIALGSIVNMLSSNRRIHANKDAMDNLNSSIEYMSRIVRFGDTYHCGSTGLLTAPQNCAGGDTLLAVKFQLKTYVFRLTGTKIEVSDDGGTSYKPLTGSNVLIDRLRFFVFGTNNVDNIQPYVLVVIRGRVVNDPTGSAVFDVQTIMTQRDLDLP